MESGKTNAQKSVGLRKLRAQLVTAEHQYDEAVACFRGNPDDPTLQKGAVDAFNLVVAAQDAILSAAKNT